MAWSAEKFKLEEDDEDDNNDEGDERDDEDDRDDDDQPVNDTTTTNNSKSATNTSRSSRIYVLAVCLADGKVILMRSFDDLSPVTIHTGLRPPLHAEWSNSRKVLAVAGSKDQEHYYQANDYINLLKFYSDVGTLIYTIVIPYTQVCYFYG